MEIAVSRILLPDSEKQCKITLRMSGVKERVGKGYVCGGVASLGLVNILHEPRNHLPFPLTPIHLVLECTSLGLHRNLGKLLL